MTLHDLLTGFPYRPGPPVRLRVPEELLVRTFPVIVVLDGRIDGPFGARRVHILYIEQLGSSGAGTFGNLLHAGSSGGRAKNHLDLEVVADTCIERNFEECSEDEVDKQPETRCGRKRIEQRHDGEAIVKFVREYIGIHGQASTDHHRLRCTQAPSNV